VHSTDTIFQDNRIIALFKTLKTNVSHCFSQSKKKRMQRLKEQLKDKGRKLSSMFIATANWSCFTVAISILLVTVFFFSIPIKVTIVFSWSQRYCIRSLCSYVVFISFILTSHKSDFHEVCLCSKNLI